MPLKILRQDIKTIKTDAIVCSSPNQLEPVIVAERASASASYKIQVEEPVWIDGKHQEEKILYQAYQSALTIAKKMELSSIAFPVLASGEKKYPAQLAVKVAMKAFRDFLETDEMDIVLQLCDKKVFGFPSSLVASIDQYINDYYIDEQKYSKECMVCQSIIKEGGIFADGITISEDQVEGLEELMNQREETFTQMLLRLIDERGMTDAEAYKRANVDRKLFSKIRSNQAYTPSKKTIFSFAIALQLSMEETEELLKKAGFAFSNCIKFDVVISFFIEHKMYDIFEINEILFQYDLPLLGV
ncbi:MAG: macro domain-containing protein [Eubacterium sp.]|nr:macro domain-containing protein [Eubacterium sp.]